ncbi:MAG: Uma2 family endonuclease [Cyanobacteriota bacterium]|nr:Uma2 family endonuclease [Cyanobacteriota bacterium]
MIAEPQHPPRMTPEEYLEWEAKQELRYEYIDGEILAMTGGTIPHTKIYLNLYTALRPHLSQRGCEAYVSDVKVQTNQNNRSFYPDLVVTCHPDDLKARDCIEYPTVIMEVLSPSAAYYANTKKFKYYRQIPSLQEYVLIDLESKFSQVYRRGEGKMWLNYLCEGEEAIALDSIEFECNLNLIYEGVSFKNESNNPKS